MRHHHDRRGRATSYVHGLMPLLLPADRWAAWLYPNRSDPTSLLAADTDVLEGLEIRPVGRAVGNVRNNGPELTMQKIIH